MTRESGIPSRGEQQKHGVITLELCSYFYALKAVRYHLAIEGDLPFPARRLVCHRHLKHA